MAVISMKALLETGVHFGHRTRRWNPKMKPFIFTERNGIHILDLQQTIVMIDRCYNLIRETAAQGGSVLFVGTKRQAADAISREAARAAMPYVSERWLGGTLTNWQTIRQRINYLRKLEARRDIGEFNVLKKRERLMLEREIEKLNMRLGGIRYMTDLPKLLFVVDINQEETSVVEANKMGIPVMAMVDTNCNPDMIDYVIPANDDAIRAIKLILSKMADAALEGRAMYKETAPEGSGRPMDDEEFDGFGDLSDEELLGESTLAKIRRASILDDEDVVDLAFEEEPEVFEEFESEDE